jgi:hypothetical protein
VGLEFGRSGEDSFVAVVVTKLTGALLFILLLAMVIMALLPKAADLSSPGARDVREGAESPTEPLAITTPEVLPEGIAGRPYALALAAIGGRGPLRWSLDGALPEGMVFEPGTGILRGTPSKGTPQPVPLGVRVSDGVEVATLPARLVVYQSDRPLVTPAWWKPGIPPLPWRAWLDQGVGFLLLWLVHLVGVSALAHLERTAGEAPLGLEMDAIAGEPAALVVRRRFSLYRALLRLATLSAMIGLAAWLWLAH